MELESLTDIFDDHLLNDFTDSLLNGIDLNDFEDLNNRFSFDGSSTSLESLVVKSEDNKETKSELPCHATLEALLKSELPSSCVPPAPDLLSELKGLTQNTTVMTRGIPDSCVSVEQYRRSSLPILKHKTALDGCQKNKFRNNSKSKLISDYLDRCNGNEPYYFNGSRSHFWPDSSLIDTIESSVDNREPQSGQLNRPSLAMKFGRRSDFPSKLSDDSDACDPHESKLDGKGFRRAPHNAIEKRYRASINGRIDELRKLLIPNPSGDSKLNKSAVLRQAIERIRELETKTERLQAELTTLRSLHSPGGPKAYGSSPESGISSLEPSSCSSSFCGMDFGSISPPSSGNSCNNVFQGSNGNTNPFICQELSMVPVEPSDMCVSSWPPEITNVVQSPDFEEPCNRRYEILLNNKLVGDYGLSQCPTAWTGSCVSIAGPPVHQPNFPMCRSNSVHAIMDPLSPEHLAGNLVSSRNELIAMGDSTQPSDWEIRHFKRRGDDIREGPSKLRRHMHPTPHSVDNRKSSESKLLCSPTSLSAENQMSERLDSATNSLPMVRNLLQTGDVNTRADSVRTVPRGISFAASGGSSLVARTTLCVSALCLIALDPVVLSGSQMDVNSRDVSSPSPSRRLLSALNTYGRQTNPWSVWMVYLLQWIVALCLCIWACQKQPSFGFHRKRPNNRTLSQSDSVQSLWTEAEAALTQNSWNSAERKLSQCLFNLDGEYFTLSSPSSYPEGSMRKSLCYCSRAKSWLLFLSKCLWSVTVRLPRLVRTMCWPPQPTPCLPSEGEKKIEDDRVTTSSVRWRLLELHLMVPENHVWMTDSVLGNRLLRLKLYWACVCEFMDVSMSPIDLSKKPTNAVVNFDSPLLKKGFTIILLMNKVGAPRFANRFLMRWVTHLAESNPNGNFWSRLASESILRSLFVNEPHLKPHPSRWVSPSTRDFEQLMKISLWQYLMDRCLHVILEGRHPKPVEMGPYFMALFNLCPDAITDSLPEESEDDMIHWWTRFVHAIWLDRIHPLPLSKAMPPSNSNDIYCSTDVPVCLRSPSAYMMKTSSTGLLAQILWFLYCPTDDVSSSDLYQAAQQSGLLLRECVKRTLSSSCLAPAYALEEHTVGDSRIIPFWILACESLAASRVLTTLSDVLVQYKRDRGADTSLTGVISVHAFMDSFGAALCVLQQISASFHPRHYSWIRKQISYSETFRRLVLGANPVRSRLALVHSCRQLSNTKLVVSSFDVDSGAPSEADDVVGPNHCIDDQNIPIGTEQIENAPFSCVAR